MTTDTLPQLRPLSIGQLLDQAIRLYRRNFLKFIAIIAVVQIPLTLINLLVSLLTYGSTLAQFSDPTTMYSQDPSSLFGADYWAGLGGSCLLSIIGVVLIQTVATAALTQVVADHYLGRQISFADAYRRVGRSWLALALALLLLFLLILALGLWMIVPCVGWLTGPGVLAYVSMVIMGLVVPVTVLERQPAHQALLRTWDLARRRFWPVMGFVTVLYLFTALTTAGPSTLLGFVFGFFRDEMLAAADHVTVYNWQTVIESLVALVTGMLYLPLQITCITLLYFDLRVRTEGFDLALMAESTLDEQVDAGEVTAQAPSFRGSGLLTWVDVGNFALLTVAVGVLYAALYAALMALGLAIFSASGLPGL